MSDTETANWKLERDGDNIAWLCFDKADARVNVLSRSIIEELHEHLSELENSPPSGLVIWSGKKASFVLGADIKEFTSMASGDEAAKMASAGQKVFAQIVALPCPSVALVNGFALGGGLELALACRYRVGADNGKVSMGLPEVRLGINPGFGGTVRSVRLLGVTAAMDLMLSGRFYNAKKALAAGLLDRLVPENAMREAAKKLIASKPPVHSPSLTEKLMNSGLARGFVAGMIRKKVAGRANPKHYPAPYAMIDMWRTHGASDAQFDAEATSLGQLMAGDTGRNLIRVFMLQDKLKSLGGKIRNPVQKLHVVGAGAMGGGIAAWSALRGIDVTLQDREEKYVQPAIERAAKLFEKKLKSADEVAAAKTRLKMDVAGDGVDDADLVIEAIYEDVDAKKALYASLEPRMKPDALLATNTSSLMLEIIAADLPDPTRLFGLHFFNPVEKMPLVEVIRQKDTPEETLRAGIAFTRAIDRLPLPCGSAPGFVVNRVLLPYMIEASLVAQEGVAGALIDRAAEDFGMPMGPIKLSDIVGLDVAFSVSKILGEAFGYPVPERLKELVEQKKLGQKTGEGSYVWQDGKAIVPDAGSQTPPADLTDRLFMPMLNAAVALWSEGVIDDLDLLDAGVIFGTGFAPFRGGPINYARERGIDDVVRTMEALADRHGERFKPHPAWNRLRNP